MLTNDLHGPVATAYAHLVGLMGLLPPDLSNQMDLEHIAAVKQRWPVWPTPALSDLVGPPSVILKTLDLRWLHRFEATVLLLNHLSRLLGGPEGGPSGLSLIVERAPLYSHRGWGETSAGGSCRILNAADGAIAVNLPREEDLASVPAWLEVSPQDAIWGVIESGISERSTQELIRRAESLGMAVSAVGEASAIQRPLLGSTRNAQLQPNLTVVDLSSMWAGPLCGWFLARNGATVFKVESPRRPDRGRLQGTAFYKRLNHGKQLVEIDFDSKEGKKRLDELIEKADVIIESSRPRALEALGISAEKQVQRGAIWCSITGYGRHNHPKRIGFGDDAAAAGSLLASVDDALWFIGDAAADPITGTTAALLTLGYIYAGVPAFLDVPLASSVATHTLNELPEGKI